MKPTLLEPIQCPRLLDFKQTSFFHSAVDGFSVLLFL